MARKNKNMRYNDAFPVRLRALIDESQDVKQKEIAAAAGVTRQTVGYWCTGDTVPDALSVMAIAKLFGVSCDWLLGQTDVRTTDASMQKVCDFVGVSEKSIQTIKELARLYSETEVSRFLECPYFEGFASETISLHSDALYYLEHTGNAWWIENNFDHDSLEHTVDQRTGGAFTLVSAYDELMYKLSSARNSAAVLIDDIALFTRILQKNSKDREASKEQEKKLHDMIEEIYKQGLSDKELKRQINDVCKKMNQEMLKPTGGNINGEHSKTGE